MLADPHPRSAHRASPASGLAALTPTALIRQAQAGHARARQAIIRQAQAGQARAHQAIIRQTQAGQARAHQAIIRQALAGQARTGAAPARQPGPPRPRTGQEPDPLPTSRQSRTTGRPSSPLNSPGPRTSPEPELPVGPLRSGSGWEPGEQAPLGTRHNRRSSAPESVGFQTAVWLAAEWQAAGRQCLADPETDPQSSAQSSTLDSPRPAPHRQRRPADTRRRSRPKRRAPRAVDTHQRSRPKRRAPRAPQETPQSLLRGLAAVIILAIVGLSAFFIIAEERRGSGRESAAAPASEPGIASRIIDPEPLTQREVFPSSAVQLSPGTAGYQVTVTHSDSECRTATIGELGALLDDNGCDQVVRARLTAPYGGYQVTAGVFNLADEAGAALVSELAGPLVENGRGTFATLGGAAGDPLSEPLAQVGWHSRGHFLLYCVVARPDGQLVTDDDPYAATITAELVEQYLGEQVVGQRTLDP